VGDVYTKNGKSYKDKILQKYVYGEFLDKVMEEQDVADGNTEAQMSQVQTVVTAINSITWRVH